MSARIMTKLCIHCRKAYSYNPSVGDWGKVCPHCHKLQDMSYPTEKGR
ncbi:MAG: hypothetical protein IKU07_01770 [Oscillospiraceae bacterium]|nr:hypothetical protein [Oscillospiraceae bacterium]